MSFSKPQSAQPLTPTLAECTRPTGLRYDKPYPRMRTIILWVDIDSHSDWKPLDDFDEPMSYVVTQGALLGEDDTYVYVGMDVSHDRHKFTRGRVIKGAILKREDSPVPDGFFPG